MRTVMAHATPVELSNAAADEFDKIVGLNRQIAMNILSKEDKDDRIFEIQRQLEVTIREKAFEQFLLILWGDLDPPPA